MHHCVNLAQKFVSFNFYNVFGEMNVLAAGFHRTLSFGTSFCRSSALVLIYHPCNLQHVRLLSFSSNFSNLISFSEFSLLSLMLTSAVATKMSQKHNAKTCNAKELFTTTGFSQISAKRTFFCIRQLNFVSSQNAQKSMEVLNF